MRERIEALGGRLDAGAEPDGGWLLRALTPTR
jgi:signal transduction histidine kinase